MTSTKSPTTPCSSLASPSRRIKKVIFHGPATIVIWDDNTKTVVKCMDGDVFDPEKGLAMAISKRIFGDDFHSTFKRYLKEAQR